MRKKQAFVAALLLLVGSFAGKQPAKAFGISPALLDFSAQQGQTLRRVLTIANTDAYEQTFFLRTVPFRPSSSGGSPEFVLSENDQGGFSQWITFDRSSLTVGARTKIDVPFTIIVPPDASAGGHYAAILVSDTPSEVVETNGASVSASAALLLFLVVEGEMDFSATLSDFSVKVGDSPPSRLEGTFFYRLQNQGNIHAIPKGTVTFKDVFGRTLGAADANPSEARVLPGSSRLFEAPFGSSSGGFFSLVKDQARFFAVGPVTAILEISLDGKKMFSEQVIFWLIPWHLLVLVIGGVLLLGFLFRMRRKKVFLPPVSKG